MSCLVQKKLNSIPEFYLDSLHSFALFTRNFDLLYASVKVYSFSGKKYTFLVVIHGNVMHAAVLYIFADFASNKQSYAQMQFVCSCCNLLADLSICSIFKLI